MGSEMCIRDRSLDRSLLLLHVFDLKDEAQFIQHFKATYERPLMEIFE